MTVPELGNTNFYIMAKADGVGVLIVNSEMASAWMDSGPGARRRILCHDGALMMVEFRFQTGGEGLAHSHPHVQTTYVQSGLFRFTVAGETADLGPGDAMLIPSNAVHSCICLEGGVLLDAFTPCRDDFLAAHDIEPA